MVGDLKDNEGEGGERVMKGVSGDVGEKIIRDGCEDVFNEELDRVGWDEVCDGVRLREKEIWKVIVEGGSLKEICGEVNKSE